MVRQHARVPGRHAARGKRRQQHRCRPHRGPDRRDHADPRPSPAGPADHLRRRRGHQGPPQAHHHAEHRSRTAGALQRRVRPRPTSPHRHHRRPGTPMAARHRHRRRRPGPGRRRRRGTDRTAPRIGRRRRVEKLARRHAGHLPARTPPPGAQLSLFEEIDGWRYQLFATNTPLRTGGRLGQLAFLEARHRAHARVEDTIRTAKATGMNHLPSNSFDINQAWCLAIGIACDLLAWLRLLCLTSDLATAEPKTLRYRLLHTAARLIRGQRKRKIRIPATWPWATELQACLTAALTLPKPTYPPHPTARPKEPAPARGTGDPTRQSGPRQQPNTRTADEINNSGSDSSTHPTRERSGLADN